MAEEENKLERWLWYYCIICGLKITHKKLISEGFSKGHKVPICDNLTCLGKYDKIIEAGRDDKFTTEQFCGFCSRCGKPHNIAIGSYRRSYTHINCAVGQQTKISLIRLQEFNHHYNQYFIVKVRYSSLFDESRVLVCKECSGEYANIGSAVSHYKNKHETPPIQNRPNKVYLKPWKDPESLFCDTDFLEKLLKKKIRHGKECTEGVKVAVAIQEAQ